MYSTFIAFVGFLFGACSDGFGYRKTHGRKADSKPTFLPDYLYQYSGKSENLSEKKPTLN